MHVLSCKAPACMRALYIRANQLKSKEYIALYRKQSIYRTVYVIIKSTVSWICQGLRPFGNRVHSKPRCSQTEPRLKNGQMPLFWSLLSKANELCCASSLCPPARHSWGPSHFYLPCPRQLAEWFWSMLAVLGECSRWPNAGARGFRRLTEVLLKALLSMSKAS